MGGQRQAAASPDQFLWQVFRELVCLQESLVAHLVPDPTERDHLDWDDMCYE